MILRSEWWRQWNILRPLLMQQEKEEEKEEERRRRGGGRRRGKEVKQFVKLSCQPLHGGILPTAKMNILFLMRRGKREIFSSALEKICWWLLKISWSMYNYIEIEEGDIFANFFQDSISEMGFVRKRPTVRVQLSLWQAFAKVPPDIVSPKCISQLHFNCISLSYFSSVVSNCTAAAADMMWIGFWQKLAAALVSLFSNLLKTSAPEKLRSHPDW